MVLFIWNYVPTVTACVKKKKINLSSSQDFGASRKRWSWHPKAEMVAKERPLRSAEPHRCSAGRTSAASPQLCWCVLHPRCRAAAGSLGSCTGDVVEQQPLPERAAQRGDHWQLVGPGPRPDNPEPGHGGHHRSPCATKALVKTQTPGPPGPAQRCHCHTLLYGSSRRWRQPRFSRAAVHPVIIGVPLVIVQTLRDQSSHYFSYWERGWGLSDFWGISHAERKIIDNSWSATLMWEALLKT